MALVVFGAQTFKCDLQNILVDGQAFGRQGRICSSVQRILQKIVKSVQRSLCVKECGRNSSAPNAALDRPTILRRTLTGAQDAAPTVTDGSPWIGRDCVSHLRWPALALPQAAPARRPNSPTGPLTRRNAPLKLRSFGGSMPNLQRRRNWRSAAPLPDRRQTRTSNRRCTASFTQRRIAATPSTVHPNHPRTFPCRLRRNLQRRGHAAPGSSRPEQSSAAESIRRFAPSIRASRRPVSA